MQTGRRRKELERKQEGKNRRAEKVEVEKHLEPPVRCKMKRERGLWRSSTGGKDVAEKRAIAWQHTGSSVGMHKGEMSHSVCNKCFLQDL